jgi:hypothetical protein
MTVCSAWDDSYCPVDPVYAAYRRAGIPRHTHAPKRIFSQESPG